LSISLPDQLATATGLSRQSIKRAMQKGAVWLTRGQQTDRIRRATKPGKPGDQVHLYYDEGILATVPTPCELISDEDAYSVWYKPYGVRSQGAKWGDHCTVYRWAEQHLEPQRPAFIVHRLDRAATGLILLAHKKRVATQLSKLFEQREIEKRYHAIVHGQYPISDDPRIVEAEIDGRNAKSTVYGISFDANTERTLVEVDIETGRKHQIRRHLAGLGFPVVGDRLYGRMESSPIPQDEPNLKVEPNPKGEQDLQLVAMKLAFKCPVSGEMRSYGLPDRLLLHLQPQVNP